MDANECFACHVLTHPVVKLGHVLIGAWLVIIMFAEGCESEDALHMAR